MTSDELKGKEGFFHILFSFLYFKACMFLFSKTILKFFFMILNKK